MAWARRAGTNIYMNLDNPLASIEVTGAGSSWQVGVHVDGRLKNFLATGFATEALAAEEAQRLMAQVGYVS